MGIATGLRGRARYLEVKDHRWTCYLKALDDLFEGKTTPEYVSERAKKCEKIIRRCP
jgi:hypothetical protein